MIGGPLHQAQLTYFNHLLTNACSDNLIGRVTCHCRYDDTE